MLILVVGLHIVSWRCLLGVSFAVFTTIFTAVLTYVISTAAMSGPAILDAARSAAARRHYLSFHRPSPSVTGYVHVRWASGHRAAQCGHVTVTRV